MKNVHLIITDLFLPGDFAAEVSAKLCLPALEKILARGTSIKSDTKLTLDETLCGLFSIPCTSGAPIASLSAAFDGLGDGHWLRADPVHVRLQREQVVLLPKVNISTDEAMALCASLNAHFADQGMEFFAPHPERWYVKLTEHPDITTVPLSQVAGRNIHGNLPGGGGGRRWHQLFNEIQMLLFAHPLNEAREARGELPINSVWFWGGGAAATAQCDYSRASSDGFELEMLAAAARIPYTPWQPAWQGEEGLLVWTGLRAALQGGDLAAWRDALQQFEHGYAQPLWHALRSGQIAQLQVDIVGTDRQSRLRRPDTWTFWQRCKKLADYSAQSRQD